MRLAGIVNSATLGGPGQRSGGSPVAQEWKRSASVTANTP